MIRPSALPMLAVCPRYEGEDTTGNEDTQAGTLRHIALGRALSYDPDPYRGLSEEDAEAVRWAKSYIFTKAPTPTFALALEKKVNPLDSEFQPLFPQGGTPDVVCGPYLFDLKTRERDYTAQMAAYALHMFQEGGWDKVEFHLLFTQNKRAQVFTLTEDEATKIVNDILARVKDPQAEPVPCDYCGWCSKRLTCPALLKRVEAVAAARDDWGLSNYHASELTSPEEMGKALRLARCIKEWAESVEYHAKEMAIKQGVVPAGFKLQSRQGARFVASVADAFPRCGLPQDEFLRACDLKFSALVEAYSAFHGQKKAPSERDLEVKLGEVLQRKAPTQSLVAVK